MHRNQPLKKAGPDPRSSGATGQRMRVRDRLQGYFLNHRLVCAATLLRLRQSPVQTLMTTLVIAIALGLPAAMYLGVINLKQLSDGFEDSARITVFLQRKADAEVISDLHQQLKNDDDIAGVTYISREQALEEFKALSGFGNVLAMLDENPLPPVLLLQPALRLQNNSSASGQLVERLADMPLVDDVKLDMKWVQRLQAVLDVSRRLSFSLGALLALGVLLIVGNTIRLAIENRREEIVVVKLVGGTNGYVRRPFLYTGVLYGAIGGFLAWFLVWIGSQWLGVSVVRLMALYQSSFHLQGLGFSGLVVLVAIASGLGLIGAWLAVTRHLSEIEPK